MAIEGDEVVVCWRPTSAANNEEYLDALSDLSQDEHAQAGRFVFDTDRRNYVFAHALLRRTLSSLMHDTLPRDWVLKPDRLGKPQLTPARNGLTFNLTHTMGVVACAVARHADVGVDVERVGRCTDVESVASSFFSPIEVQMLARKTGVDRQVMFTEIWTLKEAYLKALGVGLSHPLDTFGFRCGGSGELRFELPVGENASAWRIALLAPLETHRLAIAVRRLHPSGQDMKVLCVGAPHSSARLVAEF
jgi:4'-phosphopantetheinyl transferase